jgi:hypothetical protein
MKFHYLKPALIISGDYILLAREIGADNTFLPGGHVEPVKLLRRPLFVK